MSDSMAIVHYALRGPSLLQATPFVFFVRQDIIPRAGFCIACPAGKRSNANANTGYGATACVNCPAGTYQSGTGSPTCPLCAPGFTSTRGQSACSSCAPGTFVNTTGPITCIAAPPGSYAQSTSDTSGISTSYPCPYGSYSEVQGASSCTSCPVGTSTKITGSVSLADCVLCHFGVDPFTYRCLNDNSHLDDICWNPGQLLSLNSSIAVQDLLSLIYESPNVGIDALLSDTINVIQQCSLSQAGSEDVALVEQRLSQRQGHG
jgi:hypothetical protein